MPGFTVHTIIGSPFARAVCATLEEKHAPYTLAAIPPGAHRAPDHLARHPFARIPAFEHDGFQLYETQAILRYLDRILPSPPLTPTQPQAAARMDQVMSINDWYLFRGVADVIAFQRIIAPRLFGAMPDEAAIAAALPQARTVFAELARLLAHHLYFAGETLTLADLLVAPQLAFLAETPEWPALTQPHPGLAAWLSRLQSRPSLQATTWESLTVRATA